ncbi:spermidine/putrescine ABC transporter substrate-binding protein [Nocardioides sp. AN3]
MAGSGLSRRGLLQGAGFAAFGLASLAVLPKFSTPDRQQDPTSCRARDSSAVDKRLVISNWPEYIDADADGYKSTMTVFGEQTGIDVSYTADVNDNTEFFAKVVNQLGACQPTKRDMFMLTDWMAARMINMGWIQKLDKSKVPNLDKNLISSLRGVGWDPKREYSAPWQSGFTGIAYNKKLVKEVRTMDELLTRGDLNGKVTMLTEMRDTMGLMLLSDGKDPAKFSDADWNAAIDKIRAARRRGQIRAFTGNEYVNDLSAGNIAACVAWSGDVAAAGDDNLVFVPPEEGLMIWADNMLVPNLATHQGNAEKWIDYYYEPEVAAKLAAYVWYVTPVQGAQQAMEKVGPDLVKAGLIDDVKSMVENQLIFPTEDYLKSTHSFMALDEVKIRQYEGDFADVTSG